MNLLPPLLWIISIFTFLCIAARASGIKLPHRFPLTTHSVAVCVIILLPLVVRIMSYQPNRIHGDDLLTASFSMDYHPRTANFFAGVPEDKLWVAKFPTPYFLLQKLFLRTTGASVLTVKLSVLPYIFIVSLMTYLIASFISGRIAGIIAVILYAFLPISIYLETLGLHFISSTAVFMIFIYLLLRGLKNTSPIWFASAGVATAFCYLFYTSSYIALPILLITLTFHAIRHTSIKFVSWALIGCVITIAPFAIHAITKENYFFDRINQVSLLHGSWSDKREISTTLPGMWQTTSNNLTLSLRAMTQDDVGGHGGYTFNRQAMFHRMGIILFLTGLGMSFILLWRKGGLTVLLLVILLSFTTGVVLTIPPPAYHRLSLAFPCIAIISSIPLAYLFQTLPTRTAVLVTAIILAVYAGTGVRYVQTAVGSEALIEDAAIIQHINSEYPGRSLHIAAFPTFALEKLYPFFKPVTAKSIDAQYHDIYLKDFNKNEHYIYIVTLPNEFKRLFIEADPAGTFVPYSEKYALFVNE